MRTNPPGGWMNVSCGTCSVSALSERRRAGPGVALIEPWAGVLDYIRRGERLSKILVGRDTDRVDEGGRTGR